MKIKALLFSLVVVVLSQGSMHAASLKIVALGDSITGPRPEIRYLDKYIKWPDLLQVMIEASSKNGDTVEVINRGHAGDQSSGALGRLEEQVLSVHPQIAVILIGGNNFGNGRDPKEASARLRVDLSAIVDKLLEAKVKVLLLQYPEPKAENMEKVWVHLDDGNPVIAEVAAEKDVPTLELAPAFRKAARERPLAELASANDGVHLNPYGEVVLARAVFRKLQTLGWLND